MTKQFIYLALVGTISAIQISQSKPLIHPETGLAITTTGQHSRDIPEQHWYGQPPLALAELAETKDESFPKAGPLFPIKPVTKKHELTANQKVKFNKSGYPETEKVHTLSPELHQEYNTNGAYKFPRTAFYT